MTEEEKAQLEALYEEMGIPVEQRVVSQPAEQPTPTQSPATENIPDISLSAAVAPYLPDLGELTGSLAGAYRGMQAGRVLGLPGMAGGMIVGAAVGRGSGENVKQLIEGSFDPIKTIEDALTSGALAAGFEAIGPVFSMAKNAITNLRAGRQVSQEELSAISELQKRLQENGITLTPAQLTQSGFQKNLEKIALSGFGGEVPMRNLYEAQEEFIARTLSDLAESAGKSGRQITGEQFQETLKLAEDQLIAWARPKYAELDKAARNTPINIQSTEQTLRNAIKRGQAGRKEGSTLDPEVENMYQYVLGTKRNTDFRTVFDTISRLSSDLRNLQGRATNPNKKYEKALRDTIELLHGDLEKAAIRSGDPELLRQYKEVSEIYRTTMSTLNDSAISSLAAKNPEFVGSTIYQNGNVTMVQRAFSAIDEAYRTAQRAGKTGDDLPNVEELKNNIRAGYLRKLFQKVETNDTSVATASKLLKDLQANPEMKDTFNAVLTKKQQNEVKRVLAWADRLESLSAGNFSLVVRGRQSGAVNQLMTGASGAGLVSGYTFADPVLLGTSMALVAGPYWLAKRAVSGKATEKFLQRMRPLVVKFDEGKMTKSDVAAFFALMADTASDDTPAPAEFNMPGLSEKEAMEYARLQAELPD